MVDFAFTEAQQEFARIVRAFAQQELAPKYAYWDRSGEFPFEQWRKMGEIGITGICIPVEYGGQGADCVMAGIAAEEVARGDFNCGYALIENCLNGAILQHAQEPVKKEWLTGMGLGQTIMAIAVTEPRGGSDAAGMLTRAVRHGDEYILSGEKSGISMLMAAHAVLVLAKTDTSAGARGVSTLLVPSDFAGVRRTPLRDMGERAIQRGSLFLDEVRVPKDYLIGEEGHGFYQVMHGFDFSRIIIALLCIGAAAQSLAETIAYVKQREAFGRPLAKFEGVSFPIAEHATLLEAARWLCYRALWLRDQGLPHVKEAAMTKWWCPKIAVDAIHDCLLLHGHYGYTQDLPLEQRLRDVMGLEIGDGTAQVSKIVIARELFGREFLPYR
ncbi:MAG: acyl-CoA dehydrogenase family protein [Nitrospinae bacterium]|nr:acyl-CoA dehydrogenase family protein [Nitrospinota bacterium]